MNEKMRESSSKANGVSDDNVEMLGKNVEVGKQPKLVMNDVFTPIFKKIKVLTLSCP